MCTVELNTQTASIQSLHDPSIQKLHHVYHNAEGWLLPAGKGVIRNFFLGLIQGIEDTNLIKRLIVLFSAASQKDYVYTRSRSNPGLPSDTTTKSFNKEFSSKVINQCAAETLQWYRNADEHCRVTFLLYIAKLCADTGIAHQACNLCKTLLSRRKVELISKQDFNQTEDEDATSIDSSTYTFNTDDHPDLYQLATIVPDYGTIGSSTFSFDDKQLQGPRIHHFNLKNHTEVTKKKYSSDNAGICLISTSHSALSGVSPNCDYIGLLPVHLSKFILGMLSRVDLSNCSLVHSRWHQLVSQVRADEFSLQIIKEEAILMQGVSAKGSNPNYAKIQQVLAPVVDAVTQDIIKKSIHLNIGPKGDGKEHLFESTFRGLETKYVDIEERNVYCGAYNLLVLDQRSNANRVISYAGEDNLVIGFADKIIRTIDVSSGRDKRPSMQGHPASITALYMGKKENGSVFSGSYDTTIRKWNMNTGSCQMILHGHRSSVTSFDLSGDLLVSGAQDGLVKVWNTVTGTCTCTFKHSRKYAVTCVQLHNNTIASSCERGFVKVWNLKTRKLLKTMNNHGGMKVNCIRFNEYFLLSGGNDDYLLLWSMPGRQSICLKAYRHPKPVLCVELKYMCAITGCADGKIRVINMLSGDCLRVLRGNSQCDPIINIFATEDRLLVNTCSNCLVMHFEPVTWQYDAVSEQIPKEVINHARIRAKRPVSSSLLHSVNRAKRLSLASTSDKRIFQRTCSAPAATYKKTVSTPIIYVGHGSRPPSHYIDLQPEFRRPRSGYTVSQMSVRPVSSTGQVTLGSKPNSRVVSACSRSSIASRSFRRNEILPRTLPPNDRDFGNKHSITTRDKLLMRVGMLDHVKKSKRHNINTENNSISYFDRFYPRSESLARPASSKTIYPATLSKFSTMSIGNFTTKEELLETKSVLKENYRDKESANRHRLMVSEPVMDPFRMSFTFVKSNEAKVKKSSVIAVDNFLNRQLGITSEA